MAVIVCMPIYKTKAQQERHGCKELHIDFITPRQGSHDSLMFTSLEHQLAIHIFLVTV